MSDSAAKDSDLGLASQGKSQGASALPVEDGAAPQVGSAACCEQDTLTAETLVRLKRKVYDHTLPGDRVGGVLTLDEERLLVDELCRDRDDDEVAPEVRNYRERIDHFAQGRHPNV